MKVTIYVLHVNGRTFTLILFTKVPLLGPVSFQISCTFVLFFFTEYPEYSEPYNFVAQAGVWEVRNYTNTQFSRQGSKANMQVGN